VAQPLDHEDALAGFLARSEAGDRHERAAAAAACFETLRNVAVCFLHTCAPVVRAAATSALSVQLDTGYGNARNRWTGHLWRGRFGSVAMDEAHLIAAIRYVSLYPVWARLVERAEDWPWSSVRAHLAGRDDGVVMVAPVLEWVGRFADFLGEAFDQDDAFAPLRRSDITGRPIGSEVWIKRLEHEFARPLAPRQRGRKPREPVSVVRDDLFSKLSP
jgi:hypothetical protein